LWPLAGSSQQFFPFSLDQDQLSGAVDFSSLNHPLAAGDRLKICGEHFCRSADGTPVRLFGVNLAFGANFPTEADAPKVAKRLRRLGVNLVRLHHMDSSPDRNPSDARSLLTTDPYPTLNPVSVARLRTFLTALAVEGIYADLNLHVGYTFRPQVDQVPALADFPKQSKPLHIFYPRMVSLQLDYTRKVIEALKLKDNPVLGVVEINNESSLIYAWQTNQLETYLQGEYKTALQAQWNAFLKTRYGSTEKLREAWGASSDAGADMLNGKWTVENHTADKATGDLHDTTFSAPIKKGMILKQVGFSMNPAHGYIAEVEIRADVPRTVHLDIKRDVSPWDGLASKTVNVTTDWQKVRLVVQRPSSNFDKVGRFGIELTGDGPDATVTIRNWSLRTAGQRGLNAFGQAAACSH